VTCTRGARRRQVHPHGGADPGTVQRVPVPPAARRPRPRLPDGPGVWRHLRRGAREAPGLLLRHRRPPAGRHHRRRGLPAGRRGRRETSLLLAEGARLANERFLTAAVVSGWAVTLVHLDPRGAGEERRAKRAAELGKPPQNPSWVKGRITAARNLTLTAPPAARRCCCWTPPPPPPPTWPTPSGSASPSCGEQATARREPEWPLPGLPPTRPSGNPDPAVGPSTPSGVSSAHRPAPAANAWPDDAVLLTYGELRRLVALHLTLCASTMPHDRPWGWMKDAGPRRRRRGGAAAAVRGPVAAALAPRVASRHAAVHLPAPPRPRRVRPHRGRVPLREAPAPHDDDTALQLNGPSWEAMGCPEVVEVTIVPVSPPPNAPRPMTAQPPRSAGSRAARWSALAVSAPVAPTAATTRHREDTR
jgi:hypothetical protein